MTSGHRLGSLSSPPYPTPSLFLQIDGPTPESLLEPLTQPQPHPQQLQQVLVDEAEDDLERTYEYILEGDDPEIASNAIVLVDACTQWSRPSSRSESAAASPAPPVIGLRISGVVKAFWRLVLAAALIRDNVL